MHAFHDHDHLRVLTNTVTNKASPLSLEVNEYHQDRERHNIHDERGVPLQADGEDCNEGEYPNSLRPPHNAGVPVNTDLERPFLGSGGVPERSRVRSGAVGGGERSRRDGGWGARTARWTT